MRVKPRFYVPSIVWYIYCLLFRQVSANASRGTRMDQKKPQIDSPPVNEARRRLTQGGLAAPVVVLATLTSSNALATSTPYQCTISGKLSNNASQPGATSCSSLGKSCDGWKQETYWPTYKKGDCYRQTGQSLHTDPKNRDAPTLMGACMENVSWGGKRFKKFYCRKKDTSGVWRPVAPPTYDDYRYVHMTLHEVLYLGDSSGASNAALGRETVAAFLNAIKYAPTFPLKPEQVIDMFNATCSGGKYQVKDGVYWGANEVCNYFSCLHA